MNAKHTIKEVSDLTPASDAVSLEVRNMRLKWKLSQRELAERAGVTQTTISDIETGFTSPSYKTLAKIAAAVGYEVRIKLRRKL